MRKYLVHVCGTSSIWNKTFHCEINVRAESEQEAVNKALKRVKHPLIFIQTVVWPC